MDQVGDTLWDLLAEWETAYRQGRDIPAAELCRDQSALRDNLQRHIDALKSMDWLLEPLEGEAATPTPPAGNGAADLPDDIAEYTILGLIAQGGMGQVYQARHRRMDRLVALKLLLRESAATPETLRRFQQEVQAAAHLLHPHIVTAYDAGDYAGRPFLVMEYVDGVTLQEHVERTGPVPAEQAVGWIVQAARGLAYAHERGVVHGDIKPANLILSRDGVVKILDLGLARACRLNAEAPDSEAAMGTADYLPPEAIATGQLDQRGDLYSLGCTLWFLLVGKPVFGGDSTIRTILAHHEGRMPSLREARREVPEALERVYQKMVAKDPADRFTTMNDAITALQEILGHNGRTSRRMSRLLIAWMGGLTLAVTTVLLILLLNWPGDPRTSAPEDQGTEPAAKGTEPAVALASLDEVNGKINQLANWKVQRGKWLENDQGEIVGEGQSYLVFQEKLPPDFCIQFDMTIVEGMRPRVYFDALHVHLVNEGYHRNLNVKGSSILESVNDPYRYEADELLRIRVTFQGPTFAFQVNDKLVAKGTRKPARYAELRISAGDSWSPGLVRFANFRVSEP